MATEPAAETEKRGGQRILIDWKAMFRSDDAGGEVCFDSTPPAAARKGKAFARSSPDSLDFYPVSSTSAPTKGRGKRRRGEEAAAAGGRFSAMSDHVLRRDIEAMSDGELRREIAGIPTFGLRYLSPEEGERNRRLLPLLQNETRRRDAAKDGDDCNRVARSSASVFRFDIEDELSEDDAHRYCQKPSLIRSMKTNYGSLGVQTRKSSNQTGPRKPITEDKMYSSKTSPTALCGHTLRVRAVGPKEHDNEKSWHNENNYHRKFAKRREAHHEDSSLLHQKVNDVVLLDDEDVQPDEPVDRGVPDKWKGLKIYYPSSDDPEAVELSSSDIRCLNPGVYLSSPVINYYIQYIKRAKMHVEYGTDKFYMFNTYFYSKLQEALLDKGKFLKLRRWWKGVNIFQRGYIILPIHGTSHWSLIIVCMPSKESNSGPIILHLDSLGMHPSAEIFDTVGRYLEEEWRHLRKNPPSVVSISDTIWQDLPGNVHTEKVEVPGQNNAYDCGIFMLYYIQQFIGQAPERFTRDFLDMLSRSWFRSEDTAGLRNRIRELLLNLFESARADDAVSEAAASDGSDEECIIKEGESKAVGPRVDSLEMVVGGVDSSTRDGEDFMEVRSLGGTPSTTLRSDDRIRDSALSEAATLSDIVKDADTSTRAEEDFMEVRSLGGTPLTTRRSDGRNEACALSEAATLSDSVKDDDVDTIKTDSASSETEQDVKILPSGSSKNNEEVIQRAPGQDMYCADSCDSDVEEVDHRRWKAKHRRRQMCQIG